MKYIVNNIRMPLDHSDEELKAAAAKKLGAGKEQIKGFRISKESVDARRKQDISIVYSVIAEVEGRCKPRSDSDVRILEETPSEPLKPGNKPLKTRPLVIGSGPAGLFAGLVLAQEGYRPVIIERGESVENRSRIVHNYWQTGVLDTRTNVQFGEGGAGTFSDGKLTTRINDKRCEKVLLEFWRSGAPEEILYRAKPHIGTDILKRVVADMRNRIIALGGEYRFNTRLTGVCLSKGRLAAAILDGREQIDAEVLVLAIGHSARDTFQALLEQGLPFIQKPFSIGVRIEHPQEVINHAQYGSKAGHPRLGVADYQLFCKLENRTAYSFCMCPGGIVVAAASEENTIVTNGMSEFARDRENANSALVVSVGPEDFGSSHPLAGVEFQRRWERLAFEAGGRSNAAPVQRLEDFLRGEASSRLGQVKPSYTGRTQLADINTCLPDFVTDPLKRSIAYFDRKLKGFGMPDAILTGVETRTSSPVRIPRGDTLEAEGAAGIYPAGEGAGYAGGIVSAAVDGIRVAEQIIRTYARP